MQIPSEQWRLERRFNARWRRRVRTLPNWLRPSLRERLDLALPRRAVVLGVVLRVFGWAVALVPGPAGGLLLVAYALAMTTRHAFLLGGRGTEEMILSTLGASDELILRLSRRWITSRILLTTLDVAVFLGIWAVMGRIPIWAWAMAIPLTALTTWIGMFLMLSFLPRQVLRVVPVGTLAILYGGCAIGRAMGISSEALIPVVWFVGALSPLGWILLLVENVTTGAALLWLVIPVVAALAWHAVHLARWHTALIFARIGPFHDIEPVAEEDESEEENEDDEEEDSSPQEQEEEPEPGVVAAGESEAASDEVEEGSFAGELATFRCRNLVDYFDPREKPAFRAKPAILIVLSVLAAAAWMRMGAGAPNLLQLLPLPLALVFAVVYWLPLFGIHPWLANVILTINRPCSIFTFYPISLRSLLKGIARRDIGAGLRAAPFLFLLGTAALMIARSLDLPTAGALSGVLTLAVLLMIPLKWAHLADGALAKQPAGLYSIARGILGLTMMIFFIFELLLLMLALALELPFRGLVGIAGAGFLLGAVNAILAMLFRALTISAFERSKWDLVKPLPRK
jgi:hypothetical protein